MFNKYIFIVAIVGFNSCTKDKVEQPVTQAEATDTSIPLVTLTSPADSLVYHNGDTVFIAGTVTDNDLHEGSIEIKDDTTSQIYFTVSPYVHGLHSATINYSWVVNVTHNAAATLSVSYTDHGPNTGLISRKLILLL